MGAVDAHGLADRLREQLGRGEKIIVKVLLDQSQTRGLEQGGCRLNLGRDAAKMDPGEAFG